VRRSDPPHVSFQIFDRSVISKDKLPASIAVVAGPNVHPIDHFRSQLLNIDLQTASNRISPESNAIGNRKFVLTRVVWPNSLDPHVMRPNLFQSRWIPIRGSWWLGSFKLRADFHGKHTFVAGLLRDKHDLAVSQRRKNIERSRARAKTDGQHERDKNSHRHERTIATELVVRQTQRRSLTILAGIFTLRRIVVDRSAGAVNARNLERYCSDASFRPIMPARISRAEPMRSGVAASPRTMMPRTKAPTAPMPVQMA